jgi:hypothetical protein
VPGTGAHFTTLTLTSVHLRSDVWASSVPLPPCSVSMSIVSDTARVTPSGPYATLPPHRQSGPKGSPTCCPVWTFHSFTPFPRKAEVAIVLPSGLSAKSDTLLSVWPICRAAVGIPQLRDAVNIPARKDGTFGAVCQRVDIRAMGGTNGAAFFSCGGVP